MIPNLRRFLVTLLLACSGVVLSQMPAHACRCTNLTVEQQANRADAVFSGVLRDSSSGSTGRKGREETTYDIEAETVYKGDITASAVEVTSRANSCSLGDLPADKRYIFFVTEDGADLAADQCGGTERADGKLTRQVEKVLGEGTPLSPEPTEHVNPEFTRVSGADPEDLTRLAAPGLALVLLGVLGLLVVRRRAARD